MKKHKIKKWIISFIDTLFAVSVIFIAAVVYILIKGLPYDVYVIFIYIILFVIMLSVKILAKKYM